MTEQRPPIHPSENDWPAIPSRDYHGEIKAERDKLFQQYVDANESRIDAERKLAIAVAALTRIADATDIPVCSERNRPWVTRFCEETLAAISDA